jgi:hypothetical protein
MWLLRRFHKDCGQLKYVQCGINYNNKQVIWSAMVQGYAKVVNNLFKLRSLSPLANFSNPNNMTAILLNNMLWEEDIARQRAPHDNKIFAKLHQTAIATNQRIQSVTSFLTSWLLVATSDLA